ncbi:SurA N-terminal domain-containing protein [Virgibacillus siamensis]|uniref:SurA N-terminal domain-containing protein n=1 Tax=Virgibacillus siamensis TaxID=480071 RepID=UPI0009853D36|nr:SurA N-terminal domain-containing protein [Virgibacillus siamensis]
MKKFIMLMMALLIAVVLGACGDDSAKDKSEDKNADKKTEQAADQKKVEITDKEKVKDDKVVLKVNDNDINGEQYNAMYAQTKIMMHQYGQDVSDTKKIKQQTMDILVQQELLKQDAKEKGIKVSDDQVQKKFDKTKSQNKEQFSKVLDRYHLTEEVYKNQLAFELTLQKYIDQEITGTKVTDKEVKAQYDKLKKQRKQIPKFNKIKDQLKQQMQTQKEQQKLQAKVKNLKDEAQIKEMI